MSSQKSGNQSSLEGKKKCRRVVPRRLHKGKPKPAKKINVKKGKSGKKKQDSDNFIRLMTMVRAARVIQGQWKAYQHRRELSEEIRLAQIKDVLDYPNTPDKHDPQVETESMFSEKKYNEILEKSKEKKRYS